MRLMKEDDCKQKSEGSKEATRVLLVKVRYIFTGMAMLTHKNFRAEAAILSTWIQCAKCRC